MSTYRNATLFVLLAILWGTAFMAIKAGLAFIPPVSFAAIRYDIAAVIMLGYAASVTERWRPRTRADWTAVALNGLLVIGAYNAFLFVGQEGVTSAIAAILVALNPILATAVSRIALPDERLSLVGTIGLLLGFVGVGIVARPNPAHLLTANVLAQLLILGAAASIALGSVLVQRVDDDMSGEGATAWACLVGAVMLHATTLGIPGQSLAQAQWTIGAVLAVGYLGVLASAVGYFIYFDLLDRLGPIEINLISYVTPIPAAVSGWLVLGETIDLSSILGFVVIFGGFVLIKRKAIVEELPRLRTALGRTPE
jgi:drug/metabolite transporter (DMT)-like permease